MASLIISNGYHPLSTSLSILHLPFDKLFQDPWWWNMFWLYSQLQLCNLQLDRCFRFQFPWSLDMSHAGWGNPGISYPNCLQGQCSPFLYQTNQPVLGCGTGGTKLLDHQAFVSPLIMVRHPFSLISPSYFLCRQCNFGLHVVGLQDKSHNMFALTLIEDLSYIKVVSAKRVLL